MAKLLVVDDMADLLELYRIVLETAGHEVIEAGGAEEGLRILETDPPDGMLLDLEMPGMNGWEVLRILRERLDLRPNRVVVCSGHSSDAERDRALAEGASRYLVKPFPVKELTQVFADLP